MSERNQRIQNLLCDARSGNQAGMGRLAVVVWERLYPFVFRSTLRHDVTEDVLQETLMTMVQQVASLRENRRFWPWVYRIAASKIQNVLRQRRRSSARALLFRNRCHPTDAQASSDSLLDAKIRDETLQQVSAVVQQLSHQHRDVLRLRCYEQLPYAQIALVTRTTPSKVRARFHRAKKSLKAHLLCVAR
jgi:RNA polymerase sigma-70 factor (ECF subfamily)